MLKYRKKHAESCKFHKIELGPKPCSESSISATNKVRVLIFRIYNIWKRIFKSWNNWYPRCIVTWIPGSRFGVPHSVGLFGGNSKFSDSAKVFLTSNIQSKFLYNLTFNTLTPNPQKITKI